MVKLKKLMAGLTMSAIALFLSTSAKAELSDHATVIIAKRACARLDNGATIGEVLDIAEYEIRRNDPELRQTYSTPGESFASQMNHSLNRVSNSLNSIQAYEKARNLVGGAIVHYCPHHSQYLADPDEDSN